jgi:hypothetical protein
VRVRLADLGVETLADRAGELGAVGSWRGEEREGGRKGELSKLKKN